MDKREVISKLQKYKEYKADIVDLEIKIFEIKEEVGLSAISYGESAGKTYKISRSTENQALGLIKNTDEIEKQKKWIEMQVKKIENALSVLKEEEKEVIELIYIKGKEYWYVRDKLKIGQRRVNQIENHAIKKMYKYIIS